MADLIDRILPSTEVHIIAGPSGGGKTTWALQTFVLDWQKGHDVLGYASHPCPWVYISSDRSLDSVQRTMARLGITNTDISAMSAVDMGTHDMDDLIKNLSRINPQPKFLYIDGMLNLLPDVVHPNDNKMVSKWLAHLTRKCKKDSITILGSLHSPKMKSDEYYDNPRQRISGGASWAGFADTVILVEPEGVDADLTGYRRLMVLPRNERAIVKHLVFNREGRLVDREDDLRSALFDAFINSLKAGEVFTHESLTLIFEDVPQPTLATWLADAIKRGTVEHISRGKYRKAATPTL